ncbi:phosphotransferase [Bordetella avium]|uniref:Hydroxylysine kinase n=1 Tax=Bordetella avium (strain 197N) TaxID=360910 RepID=Q2KYU7_BORA1|nr:phosphotransferase [Bordetella avium]RIQ49522.1 homoserine kinase [Bordetella avium]RIQ74607.1 homoserine kinase [Bordetella avium]CAJ48066.1 putative phosphotransferase [Bordetella avium 197N]
MSASAAQALFAAEPPKLTPGEAEALAARFYGLTARADTLSSERDQNFRLTLADGQRYVLKATHPAEDPAVTDFQTQAQLHMMRAGGDLPIPRLVPGLAGEYVCWHEGAEGARRAIRLITFIQGRPLHSVGRSAAQRRALARALARVDHALSGFEHPMADHELLWDVQHADRLADLLPLIEEPERRALAEKHMAYFTQRVRPALMGLRRQVIHNDLNAYNVMVGADNADHIAALLDFGDMVRAPLVQDIAVACAYQLEDAPDPLSTAARDCVASYHQVLPLGEAELALIPDLIAARLLITVAITGWRARQHPENRQYILRNNALAWNGLARLDALPLSQARDIVFAACHTSLENSA